MTHQMKLQPKPFEAIKSGRKTIEMRLNDEKRSLVKIGDSIEFTNIESNEKMLCKVQNIYRYKDFNELFKHHDKISLGYEEDEEPNPRDLLKYYSEEKILQYGVLGIEIEVE